MHLSNKENSAALCPPEKPSFRIHAVAIAMTFAFWAGIALPVANCQSNPGAPKPPQCVISWSENPISFIVSPGETSTRTISFVSGRKMGNVTIIPSASLAGVVKTAPSQIQSVTAGVSTDIQVTVSIGAGAPPGTMAGNLWVFHEGENCDEAADHVPQGGFPASANVVLNVWDGISTGTISFKIPPGWKSSSLGPNLTALTPPGKAVDPDSEYAGDILVQELPNPQGLALPPFYSSADQVNLFAESSSNNQLNLSGASFVKFTGVFGMIPTNVFAVRSSGAVVEVSDVGQLHDTDGIPDLIAASVK
jgi:hypothetical protein